MLAQVRLMWAPVDDVGNVKLVRAYGGCVGMMPECSADAVMRCPVSAFAAWGRRLGGHWVR